MKYVLAQFDWSWASAKGFQVFTDEEWTKYQTLLKSIDFSFDWYYGKNDEYTMEDGQELLEKISVSNISEDQYKFLVREFQCKVYSYGEFPDAGRLEEILEENK